MSTPLINDARSYTNTAFSEKNDAYYKMYDYLGKSRHGFWSRDVGGASELLVKKNSKDVEIIGIKNASVKYKAFDSTFVNKTDLTTTIDATSKAGMAKISVTNSSGATRFLAALTIRGKSIKRFSGKHAFVHDSFKDIKSIRTNGRLPLEVRNNFIQSMTHVRKIADWLWKLNSTEKSIYTYDEEGCLQFYQPGQWYTVAWTAGIEVISAVVKCLNVQTEISSAWGNRTVVEWAEVEQNWTFNSSYLTRFVISGAFPQDFVPNAVVVAANDYCGDDANYVCDGTNDEAEINLAIQWVKGSYGGGYVLLTEGTFVIGAAIEMLSGVTLLGRGEGTVLDRNCNDYTIEAVGGSGTEKTGVSIQNMKLTFTDSNVKAGIYLSYADEVIIKEISIESPPYAGIHGTYSDSCIIDNCLIDGKQIEIDALYLYGILWTSSDKLSISPGCKITGLYMNHAAGGSVSAIGVSSNMINSSIIGVTISDLRNIQSVCYGILTDEDCQIRDCVVEGIFAHSHPTVALAGTGIHGGSPGVGGAVVITNNTIRNIYGRGIYIAGTANDSLVTGNHAFNNGQLISYGDCETADEPHITGDGDSAANVTYSRSSTVAHTGTYSGKLLKSIAAGTFGRLNFEDQDAAVTNDMHTLVAGGSYNFSTWMYVPSVSGPLISEFHFQLYEYYSVSWNLAFNLSVAGTDAWEQLAQTVILNAATTGIILRVVFDDTVAINEFGYIDDVRVYETGVANTHSMNYSDAGSATNISGNSWE